MAFQFVLADSSRVRYATGSVMYFAQGIPAGLMNIAVPAWLASLGVSAGEIASYLSVIILPWAFKLLSGPLMDHFKHSPMGSRRPWMLGAQLGLTLSFFGLVLVDQPAEQIGLLMLLGAFINIFAATQDVAVDGMSIDLTPLEEQGRLNAFMAFGKSVGWGVSSAVSGILLVKVGLGATGLVAAAVSGLILLGSGLILERQGERLLPWSRSRLTLEPRPDRSRPDRSRPDRSRPDRSRPDRSRLVKSIVMLLRGLNAVLWTRTSLVLMAVMFLDGLIHGYGHALMPIAAVKLFGFETPEWTRMVALMGLVGAGVALGLGPLIDRFGAKRMLILTAALVALHAFLLAETQHIWENTFYVRVMLCIWIMLGPVTMVCMIALAMAVCSSASSATQFAVYMSVANLGSSAGSKLYGLVAEGISYNQAYLGMGGLCIAMLGALVFYRHQKPGLSVPAKKTTPSYTVAMGATQAGLFWSGAMRCPKCRADMAQIEINDVEVDRCSSCNGLWFDPGEVEKLRNRQAAAAIDTGDAASGKVQNLIDQYRCPRCGGYMVKQVDPKQTHIWYEQCASCQGSYFDAGEFKDLATLSVADVFKRGLTPSRD